MSKGPRRRAKPRKSRASVQTDYAQAAFPDFSESSSFTATGRLSRYFPVDEEQITPTHMSERSSYADSTEVSKETQQTVATINSVSEQQHAPNKHSMPLGSVEDDIDDVSKLGNEDMSSAQSTEQLQEGTSRSRFTYWLPSLSPWHRYTATSLTNKDPPSVEEQPEAAQDTAARVLNTDGQPGIAAADDVKLDSPTVSQTSWFSLWPWPLRQTEPEQAPTSGVCSQETQLSQTDTARGIKTEPTDTRYLHPSSRNINGESVNVQANVLESASDPSNTASSADDAPQHCEPSRSWSSVFFYRPSLGSVFVSQPSCKSEEPPPTDKQTPDHSNDSPSNPSVLATASRLLPRSKSSVSIASRGEPVSEPGHSNVAPPLTDDPVLAKSRSFNQSNFVVPTFEDTFARAPRVPAPSLHNRSYRSSSLRKVKSYFFRSSNDPMSTPSKTALLPCMRDAQDIRTIKQVVVIGVHGWFPGPAMRKLFGEPTGTSIKFATMQAEAVRNYFACRNQPLSDDQLTVISLEGEGLIADRVASLYSKLAGNPQWQSALTTADAIFVATHSQGCIVSTHLLDKLLEERKDVNGAKCHLLCLAAVSQGPFVHLSSTYYQPYFQYVENASGRELFELQNPQSIRSIRYRDSLSTILSQGVKVLMVGSINDQVVPMYSSIFSSFDHPNLLRAVFVDGQSYSAVDFMSNLISFAIRLRNAQLSDHGLAFHLSEALQGALSGLGHSLIYNDKSIYEFAVRYLVETTNPTAELGLADHSSRFENHDPRTPQNPYYLPWALRGILEDQQVQQLFATELVELRQQFEEWSPVSRPLKDVKLRLQPFSTIPLRPSHPGPKL